MTKAELNALVRTAQLNDNQPCDKLIRVTRLMAEGIWDRYRYAVGGRDDAVGEAFFVLMRVIPKMDPDKNTFSYLTTCLKNHFLGVSTKLGKHDRVVNSLREAAQPFLRSRPQGRPRR